MTNGNVEIMECGSNEVGKRLVVIILKREQLLYDIENYCYIEGDIMAEDTQHQRHMVQDVGQEGNVDRVTRVLDLAHTAVIERMYPFSQQEIHHPVIDDKLRAKPVYGIFLNVPDTFSQTTLNYLGRLVHELLVCTAVADWMSITNPAKTETWKLKAEEALSEVRGCINARMGRTRRRCHPF